MPSRQDLRKTQTQALLDDIQQAISNDKPLLLSELLNEPNQNRKRDDFAAYALAWSCERGNHGAVRFLLAQEGVDANQPSKLYKDKEDVPPLTLAVSSCCNAYTSLKSIRSDGQPPSDGIPDEQGYVTNRIDIIRSLLEHGALLHTQDANGKTVLSHITHQEVADAISASSTKSDFQKALEVQDKNGCNALMCALEAHSHLSVANHFIDNGANIHAVDGAGRSALIYAVWKNHADLVLRLVEHKDLVCAKDRQKRNIWHHVALDQNQLWTTTMLDTLLSIREEDVSVDDVDDKHRTSLHASAIYGTVAAAKVILGRSTSAVNARGPLGKTPLHFAAAYGHTELVKILTQHHAEVDSQCNGKLTPLHLACGCGTDAKDIVDHLLSQDAAVESETEERMTPLHIAAAHGQLEVVKSLLAAPHKANINAESEGGWIPLHLASWGRHAHHLNPSTDTADNPRTNPSRVNYVEVVRVLLEAGANVNQKSRAAKTALHLAAESGHEDIVRVLLQQSHIILAAKDDQGNTPLLNAAKTEQGRNIVDLLAPWTPQSIESLTSNTKRAAQEYDANVFDFQNNGSRPHRYHISIYKLLYAHYIKAGTMTEDNVSTMPEHSDDGSFRWIHLPANNLSWVHTLLTKHFIESDCADVEGFREFERSLSQLQHRGQKIHARHMRPTCLSLRRRPWDQDDSIQFQSAGMPLSKDSSLKTPLRVDSIDLLSDAPSRPPSFRLSRRLTDLDQDRFHSGPMPVTKFGKQGRNRDRQLRSYGSQARVDFARKPLRKPKSSGSANNTMTSSTHEFSSASKVKTCLFMPYLDLENKRNVDKMHQHIYSDRQIETNSETRLAPNQAVDRDILLHQAEPASDSKEYRLHIRRTLDQYRYKNVNTKARDDDQVVWRYQDRLLKDHRDPRPQGGRDHHDILMVDQLWVWVFGPQLIVTCFPQGWQHPRKKTPGLLNSILEDLNPRSGRPVLNVYELAVRIVGHCLAACDRSAERHEKLNYLDMFSLSVGTAMDAEVNTFKQFKDASDRAAQWLKKPLYEHISEAGVKAKPTSGQSEQDITAEDPVEDKDFLNIRAETLLLLEVKDIQDELGILSHVLDDQLSVLKAMYDTFRPLLANETKASQQRVLSSGDDNVLSLRQQKAEIDSMRSQVQVIYKSIVNSLEHKQRHASAIQAGYAAMEARYSRELADSTARQAASTAKAGRVLMVFTIVTVIFLPLSFLAAFFAINLDVLPHNDQNEQEMSLAFVMKYVVGVGLGTAVSFVGVAWYLHSILEWLAKKFSSQRSVVKPAPQVNDAAVYGGSSSNWSYRLPRSGFRHRTGHPQDDPEKASRGSSQVTPD